MIWSDETALLDENGADGEYCGDSTDVSSTPGEAVLTSASDFAAQAKLSREQVRSQNKADLQEILNNTEVGDDQKQQAVNTMVSDDRCGRKRSCCRDASGSKRI